MCVNAKGTVGVLRQFFLKLDSICVQRNLPSFWRWHKEMGGRRHRAAIRNPYAFQQKSIQPRSTRWKVDRESCSGSSSTSLSLSLSSSVACSCVRARTKQAVQLKGVTLSLTPVNVRGIHIDLLDWQQPKCTSIHVRWLHTFCVGGGAQKSRQKQMNKQKFMWFAQRGRWLETYERKWDCSDSFLKWDCGIWRFATQPPTSCASLSCVICGSTKQSTAALWPSKICNTLDRCHKYCTNHRSISVPEWTSAQHEFFCT